MFELGCTPPLIRWITGHAQRGTMLRTVKADSLGDLVHGCSAQFGSLPKV
jgi:hypothetical protein